MKNLSILKLLSFLFIFIVVVFLIIFFFIVPNIKNFKVAKRENMVALEKYNYEDGVLKSKIKELKELKYNNLKILRAFEYNFKEKEFLSFSKKYFTYAKLIKDKKRDYKKDFEEYSFNTLSKMKDPTVFYKFLTDINRYDNIIQVDFPISMEAVGDDINTTFKLKVFTLNNHP